MNLGKLHPLTVLHCFQELLAFSYVLITTYRITGCGSHSMHMHGSWYGAGLSITLSHYPTRALLREELSLSSELTTPFYSRESLSSISPKQLEHRKNPSPAVTCMNPRQHALYLRSGYSSGCRTPSYLYRILVLHSTILQSRVRC